jgi:hypothetical protein
MHLQQFVSFNLPNLSFYVIHLQSGTLRYFLFLFSHHEKRVDAKQSTRAYTYMLE